jgi:biotin operon repressor
MQTDVPGYVRYDTHVQNSVQVKGGTNWDLSRGALPTPIAPAPDPEPVRPAPAAEPCQCNLAQPKGTTAYLPQHHMPAHAPDVTVRFARGAVLLSGGAQGQLKKLPHHSTVVVAGHADSREKAADSLAKKRADVVARTLRKNGVTVEAVKSFGAELPLSQDAKRTDANRRVEVFTR